jgi:hypothetical protein
MCSREGEDGGHLFLKCKSVRALWRCAGLESIRQILAECCNAKEVVSRLLKIDDELQLRAVLLNNWWHERNRVREGENRRSPDDIAAMCGRSYGN